MAEQEPIVYFIGGADGPIKIGRTTSISRRIHLLQTGHPNPLGVLAALKGGAAEESVYHARFDQHRLHGEWFERTPEILAEIERIGCPLHFAVHSRPGQPRKAEPARSTSVRLRASTIIRMKADPRSPDEIMRAGLATAPPQ